MNLISFLLFAPSDNQDVTFKKRLSESFYNQILLILMGKKSRTDFLLFCGTLKTQLLIIILT